MPSIHKRFILTQIFFSSVKNRNASKPPSRPTPEFFTPPNGVRRSLRSQQLTQTIPDSICSAIRCARERFSVQTVAERPYSTELAYFKTSSSVSNGVNRHDRTENFFLIRAAVVREIFDDRRFDKITVRASAVEIYGFAAR